MPSPESILLGTYEAARAALEAKEIKHAGVFSRMGAESMTKTCYQSADHPGWVYLVSTNRRILVAEVSQLRKYAEHIRTPYLGPRETDELVFEFKKDGKQAFAFLEARFSAGYKEVKVKNDPSGNWIHKEILLNLKTVNQLDGILKFLSGVDTYLARATEDIPDFQVVWDPDPGVMLMFDPGDPENSQNSLKTHRDTIERWFKEASDPRVRRAIEKISINSVGAAVPPGESVSVVSGRTSDSSNKAHFTGSLRNVPGPSTTPVERAVTPVSVISPHAETPAENIPHDQHAKEYACPDCGDIYPSIVKLRVHRIQIHPN